MFYTMKVFRESGGKAMWMLNVSTIWMLYPWQNPWYPSSRRLGVTWSQYGYTGKKKNPFAHQETNPSYAVLAEYYLTKPSWLVCVQSSAKSEMKPFKRTAVIMWQLVGPPWSAISVLFTSFIYSLKWCVSNAIPGNVTYVSIKYNICTIY